MGFIAIRDNNNTSKAKFGQTEAGGRKSKNRDPEAWGERIGEGGER